MSPGNQCPWRARRQARPVTSPRSEGLPRFTSSHLGPYASSLCTWDSETLFNLEDNLLLFFTGYSRSASSILKDQDTRSKQQEQSMIDNLHYVKELGCRSRKAIEASQLREFAELMHVHWEHKKRARRQ